MVIALVMHRNYIICFIKYMYRAQVMIYSIYFSENELILSISFFQYMTVVFMYIPE